jgi:hypothetical protein
MAPGIPRYPIVLLSIFHYIVSGLAAFFASIPFIHLGMGLFKVLVLMRPAVKESFTPRPVT